MSKKTNSKRKKLSVDKYNFGSFVTNNQQAIAGAGNFAGQAIGGGAGAALSGAASGVAAGAFAGPIGMGIGGAIGLIGGIIGNGKRKRAEEAQRKQVQQAAKADYAMGFNADIDNINENPYGVYAKGGDVILPSINIEAGELQIDPATGKILREFKGINPETGGKYQEHATGRKKDTKDNIVTAEEGTFIITKAKAKEYKDSIDNNDKLHQNAILQNIRNKKKNLTAKFAEGGEIDYNNLAGISLPFSAPSIGFNTPPTLAVPNSYIAPNAVVTTELSDASKAALRPDYGNILNQGLSLAPSLMNIFGSGTPNHLENVSTPENRFRGQTISNMPQDINYSPLFNRVNRDAATAYNQIDNTTSSSAIGRANKANVSANASRGIQDAFFQGEGMNNQIRGQRASMFNQLGESDRGALMNTQRTNLGIETTNRQMDEGRRAERRYGLSQLQQLAQANITNSQLQDRDAMKQELLMQMFPALSPYMNKIMGGRR